MLTAHPGTSLSAAFLQDRAWSFGVRGGETHAPFLRLLPRGRIAGYRNPNEHHWEVRDGQLIFFDHAGRYSTRFTEVLTDDAGMTCLSGLHRAGEVCHVLRELPPTLGQVPPAEPGLICKLARRRRNLVVLRANEASLHPGWARDITDDERNWDLCISFYGREENFPTSGFEEYAVLQNKARKFQALQALFHTASPLWQYDYVIFPDDDLQMSWSDLNTLFAICREYDIQLAQPALDPAGVINYETTRQRPECLMRFVSMVEVMAPVFSMAALRACIHTFGLSESGFGIDYAWSKIVGGPATAIAIIDKVAVLHTRPTGNGYDFGRAMEEGFRVSAMYGSDGHYRINERGAVFL